MTDCMHLARAERADLLALLTGLTPQQWEAPSLCAGWRVRDVVAHMVSFDGLDRRQLLARIARGGFRMGRINAIGVAERRDASPSDLLALLGRHLEPRGLTTGFGGRIALLDAMIHQQDVRRPLGLPRAIPAERLVPALAFARFAPPIRAFPRIRGLRLVATDLDWAAGRGPEVRGPAEALLLAMAGRRCAVGELSGAGQPVLAARVG